jgi:carboxyl-terminal processing protease
MCIKEWSVTKSSLNGPGITFLFVIVCICFLGSYVHAGIGQPVLPQLSQDESYREIRMLAETYSFIMDKNLAQLDSQAIIAKALLGMQDFIGNDSFSFEAKQKGFVLSSKGEFLTIADASTKDHGAKELARAFMFAIRSNPQIDEQGLAHSAIRNMIKLDEHSNFLSPENYKQANMETQGKPILGLGLDLGKKNGQIKVFNCIEHSPSHKAGIIPGDEVIAINGKPTTDLTVVEVHSLLRSYGSAEVRLTIKRKSLSSLLLVTMAPDVIARQNVQHKLLQKQYAYIRILRFGEKTVLEFDKALQEEEIVSGKTIKGIVVDLRNSPGGLLNEVLDLTNRFVNTDLIVSLEGRQSGQFFAKSQTASITYPTVVLVNEFTAAGSEIMAGALQDHGRALLIGATTAGDGSIVTFLPLMDGSALNLTTHKWRLPKGRLIDNLGVVPDVDIGMEQSILMANKDGDIDAVTKIAVQILSVATTGSKEDLRKAAHEVTGKRDK